MPAYGWDRENYPLYRKRLVTFAGQNTLPCKTLTWNHRPRGYSHKLVVECQFENSPLHCL